MILRIALCTDLRRLEERRVGTVDFIVLPELADGGYAALTRGEGTHAPRDEYFRHLLEISRRHHLVIVAGSARVPVNAKAAANTSFVFQRGRTVYRYDKIHLFRPTGDHRWFRAGTQARTTTIRIGNGRVRLGLIICFDLRFPELARRLAFQGMDLLVVPARWPAVRADAWRTLLKARAIENQVFVAGCNAAGMEGGPSCVFDPRGARINEVGDQTARGWKVFVLNLEARREAKILYDTLRDARFKSPGAPYRMGKFLKQQEKGKQLPAPGSS
jgi:predicted amidohydrolase